jgi:hypothetical protein
MAHSAGIQSSSRVQANLRRAACDAALAADSQLAILPKTLCPASSGVELVGRREKRQYFGCIMREAHHHSPAGRSGFMPSLGFLVTDN